MKLANKLKSNDSPKKHKNLGRKISFTIIGILIILGCFIFFLGHQYLNRSLQPLNSHDKSVVQINIPMGASDKKIGSILQDQNIVKSGMVFDYFVNSHHYSNLKAGYYEFSPSMSLDLIAKKLEKGGSAQPLQGRYGRFLIREGDNIEQISKNINSNSKYSSSKFMNLMNDKEYLSQLKKQYPDMLKSSFNAKDTKYKLEGYLYPATYNSQNDVSLKDLIKQMLDKTNNELKPYYKEINKKGFSVQQVLSLASMIELERYSEFDRQQIAGVLLNRLNNGLPLEMKSSILYASGKSFNQKIDKKDYKIKSAYNLFKHTGYGPGPISNPSINSVKAVLNPKNMDKNYLHFYIDPKKNKVVFSSNLVNTSSVVKNNNYMR
ncbi:endolytic transglycosylase MltG [Apilactobacillus micheneri]|uniref:Endolytic murein transglycosylase n=2 Tax=Apilactobacillus micheneri TaxID=1899430 RepID=A0ABY2YX04_9LACO|nr:endolytic transglycosylase MltG [Apilactobacillus micheneri]TPR26587.1 endolytic transglycosylase MltG [Apilactobacillus micheneri]TPR28374.1 endolytic transglycosylase MltG [Apilactobacillus micheneri]TPR29061.1 endolytic transglycosylase MltG [Apilactobacillus micheneri]TPR30650.1 endolytic transglycosylase MltG [Apilactobacillus micheneri]